MEPPGPLAVESRRPILRAPLAPVALALAGGVALGRWLNLPTGLWAAAGLAAMLLGAGSLLREHWRLLTAGALLACVLCIGAVYVRLCSYAISEDDLVTYSTDRRAIFATVRGRILTSPQVYEDAPGVPGYRRGPRTGFVLAPEQILTEDGWRSVSGRCRTTVPGEADGLAAGQRVELVGTLARPRPPDNPGQYDWAAASRRRGILTTFRVSLPSGAKVLDGPAAWPERAYWHARAAARQHWESTGDAVSGKLLNALILGERSPALRELNRAMVRAGIAHFLSISGLHLGVFVGFVYAICRAASASQRRAAWVVLVVLAAYLLLAEPRAPLLRSALMAGCICAGILARRRPSSLNALAVAGVVLLAIDPMQLFEPGFQLSFAIVGGLVLFARPVRMLLFGRWVRRRGLMVFRSDQRLRRWLYFRGADMAMSAAAMVLTAQLVAAPLVAHHFGLFSPYAAVLSVLLFPLVLAVLAPGYISMALQWPMPNLSHAVGNLAADAASMLADLVQWFERLPALNLDLRPAPPWWVLLCYAALLVLVLAWKRRGGKLAAVLAVAVVAFATAWTQRPATPPAHAEFHMLSVGNGQCCVLHTPAGEVYVLDAGTQSGFDVWEQTLKPFLRAKRLPAPTAVLVSHANTDHYNAVPALLRDLPPDVLQVSPHFGEGQDVSPHVRRLLEQARAAGVRVDRLQRGQTVALDAGVRMRVLWPPPDEPDARATPNDRSLVVRIESQGRSVLLTGDIGQRPQERLAGEPDAPRADVLLMPHHGGWETTLPAFVDAAAPGVLLISAARMPRAPASASQDRIAFYAHLADRRRLAATPIHGWVRVTLHPDGPRLETMRK